VRSPWEFKIIRDPIHGYIGLTELEIRLLDTPPLQRLRRIKQLANTHLVYPGALHTRFDHSVGVLHVANRLAVQLGFNDEERELVRLAALTHDVGHSAFSHVGEKAVHHYSKEELNKERESTGEAEVHELVTREILLHHPSVKSLLGEKRTKVAELLESDETSALKGAISGPLDADKLDYLLRDSYFAGVKYGAFDLERILHTVQIVKSGDESYVAVMRKGKDALESYRLARYLMHAQVYQHHALLAADGMLIRAIQLACKREKLDVKAFTFQKEDLEFLNAYLRFDDATLLATLRDCGDAQVSQLAQRIECRSLFKCARELNLTEIKSRDALASARLSKMLSDTAQLTKNEAVLAKGAGCTAEFVILMPLTIKNPLYRLPGTPMGDLSERLLIVAEDGGIQPLDELSPLAIKSSLFSERLLVYGPAEYRDKLKVATEDWIKSV